MQMKRLILTVLAVGISYCCFPDNGNPGDDGGGSGGDDDCARGTGADSGSVAFQFTTGPMVNFSELPDGGRLMVHSDFPSPSLSTPQALKVVLGPFGVKRVKTKIEVVEEEGAAVTNEIPSFISIISSTGQSLDFEEGVSEDGGSGGGTPFHGRPFHGRPIGGYTGTSYVSVETLDWGMNWRSSELDEPDFFDLFTDNGLECMRYNAEIGSPDYMKMLEYTTPKGRTEQVAEYGMDFVVDTNSVIRQVKAPTQFLDIVAQTPYRYEVRYYDPEYVSATTNAMGVYDIDEGAPTFEKWIVENPATNSYDHLNLIREVNNSYRTNSFVYHDAQNMWKLTRDGGETFEETTYVKTPSQKVETEVFRRSGEAPVYKRETLSANKSFGYALSEDRVYTEGTNAFVTTYDHYEQAQPPGRYGRVQSMMKTDGSWVAYDYDDLGRKEVEAAPLGDSPLTPSGSMLAKTYDVEITEEYEEGTWSIHSETKSQTEWTGSVGPYRAVRYGYVPNEAGDIPYANDSRPRMVTNVENKEGSDEIVVSRTFYTYKTNSVGAWVHIVEQAIPDIHDGSYGQANNLRTVKTFYGPNDGNLLNGRLHTVEYPDGRKDIYTYERGDISISDLSQCSYGFSSSTNGYAWRETALHASAASPNGVEGKSTKDISIKDASGKEVINKTVAVVAGGEMVVSWVSKQFDVWGHATHTYYSDGTESTGYWGTGCCGMDNATDREGVSSAYTYDANKRLTTMTVEGGSEVGNITASYTYDAKGRRLTSERANGSLSLVSTNRYDMKGRITYMRDESGLETTFSYDDANRTETTTLPGGGTRIVTRYRDGKVKSITGTAVTPKYYEYGFEYGVGDVFWGWQFPYLQRSVWVKEYTGPAGANSPMWAATYTDFLGRPYFTVKLVGELNENQQQRILVDENQYDGSGRLSSMVRHGAIYSAIYTGGNQFFAGSSHNIKRNEYDGLGNLFRTGVDRDNDGVLEADSMDVVWEYALEYSGGKRIDSEYVYPVENDGTRQLIRKTETFLPGSGIGGAIGSTYTLIAQKEITDRFNKTATTRTLLSRSQKTRHQLTTQLSSSTPESKLFVYGYLQEERSSTGRVKEYDYDALGRVEEVRTPSVAGGVNRLVSSAYAYNGRNQVEYMQDTDGHRVEFAYDPVSGWRTEVKNAVSNTTYYAYDLRGNVTNEWGATYPVEYGYDDYGRLHTLRTYRDESGTPDLTTWHYDEASGLMRNKVYADDKGTVYDYDHFGRLSKRTWARAQGSPAQTLFTEYSYDALGQLTNINYSATDTPDVSLGYNRMGQRMAAASSVAAYEYEYAANGMLTNETVIAGGTTNVIARFVDAFGRPAGYELHAPGSMLQASAYAYDALGRFAAVTSSVASETSMVGYSWMDGANLLNGYTIDDAVGSELLAVGYSYETNRHYKTSVANRAGTDLISSFDYVYDAQGRRTDRVDQFGTDPSIENSFGYNVRNEVTSATMGSGNYSYAFDDIGNRIEASGTGQEAIVYAANQLNQYTSTSNLNLQTSNSLVYDDDGNLTDDGTWSCTWNGENRLIMASNATTLVVYAYDYMGRMLKRTVSERGSPASNFQLQVSNSYLWDGWNMISEASSTETNAYIWGLDLTKTQQGAGGVGGLLYSVHSRSGSDPVAQYFAYDANGNVSDLIDESGSVAAHYEYDAFGNKTASSGVYADSNPWQFSTKYWEPETGLLHYELRAYVPSMGRWMARDPIGEEGGVNIGSIRLNSIVNLIDYLGLACPCSDFCNARRNRTGPGEDGSEPNSDHAEALSAAIESANSIKDEKERPCYDIALVNNGHSSGAQDFRDAAEDSHLIIFEGHGGEMPSGGGFIDNEERNFSDTSWMEDTLEWYAARVGPEFPNNSSDYSSLVGGGRVRSYCCGGEVPGFEHRPIAPRGNFNALIESISNLKGGSVCCNPIVIRITFGPL